VWVAADRQGSRKLTVPSEAPGRSCVAMYLLILDVQLGKQGLPESTGPVGTCVVIEFRSSVGDNWEVVYGHAADSASVKQGSSSRHASLFSFRANEGSSYDQEALDQHFMGRSILRAAEWWSEIQKRIRNDKVQAFDTFVGFRINCCRFSPGLDRCTGAKAGTKGRYRPMPVPLGRGGAGGCTRLRAINWLSRIGYFPESKSDLASKQRGVLRVPDASRI